MPRTAHPQTADPLRLLLSRAASLLARFPSPRFHDPLAQLALAITAAALCALGLNSRAWCLVAGLVALGSLGLLWPWVSLRRISATLSFDRSRIQEGDIVGARLHLKNSGWFSAWALQVVHPEGSLHPNESSERTSPLSLPCISIDRATARQTITLEHDLVAPVRGLYPRRPLRLASAFPFGIAASSRPITVDRPLIVWPMTFPLPPHALQHFGRQGTGLALHNRAGHAGDVLGVRLYRRGDPLKRINWPQTAKHDQLMVCELQQPAHPVTRLLIDTNPHAHVGSGPDSSFEWAIRIAASLVHHLLQTQNEIQIETTSTRLVMTHGNPTAARKRCFDALAALQLDPDSPAPHSPSDRSLIPNRTTRSVILITTDRGLHFWTQNQHQHHLLARSSHTRSIILDSRGFESQPNQTTQPARVPGQTVRPLGIAPLWITDPQAVPTALRHWDA